MTSTFVRADFPAAKASLSSKSVLGIARKALYMLRYERLSALGGGRVAILCTVVSQSIWADIVGRGEGKKKFSALSAALFRETERPPAIELVSDTSC